MTRVVCSNCGRLQTHAARGECMACLQWRKKKGEARPLDLPPTRADAPEGKLTSQQVCDASGVSYRQLDYWTRTGRVIPSGNDALCSGTVRWWTQADVERLKAARERLEWGLTVEAAFRGADPGPCPVPAVNA